MNKLLKVLEAAGLTASLAVITILAWLLILTMAPFFVVLWTLVQIGGLVSNRLKAHARPKA